jgi:hypothetical protein
MLAFSIWVWEERVYGTDWDEGITLFHPFSESRNAPNTCIDIGSGDRANAIHVLMIMHG